MEAMQRISRIPTVIARAIPNLNPSFYWREERFLSQPLPTVSALLARDRSHIPTEKRRSSAYLVRTLPSPDEIFFQNTYRSLGVRDPVYVMRRILARCSGVERESGKQTRWKPTIFGVPPIHLEASYLVSENGSGNPAAARHAEA